jgi:hypothetical protein
MLINKYIILDRGYEFDTQSNFMWIANCKNVYINRGIVHENYKQDAYKYQCQNRWQPLVASMRHMGTCDGEISL